MIIHLHGRDRHAAMADISDHLLLRVDPSTRAVVGLQVEGFVTSVLPEHPEFPVQAEAAGVPPADIEAARSQFKPNHIRKAALSAVLNEYWGDLKPAVT